MTKGKKLLCAALIVIAAAALCVSAWCVFYLYQYRRGQSLNESLAQTGGKDEVEAISLEVRGTEPPESAAEPEPVYKTVELPVDFTELERTNADIYAWRSIPGTTIESPVLQHEGDDTFYLKRGTDGKYYACGSIFSESTYNSRTFDDPVTLLYGHNMRKSPVMFTTLNNFIDSDYFEQHSEMYIYMPDRAYRYEIFAALPYGRTHILAMNDFSDAETFDSFFSGLAGGAIYMNLRDGLLPSAGDRVLILSTCYTPSSSQRFLVMGVLAEELHYVDRQEAG